MKRAVNILFLVVFIPLIVNSQSIDRKLIGDWINPETRFILSFTDSTIGFFDWGDFEKCYIKSDTIFFETRDKIKRDNSKSSDSNWSPGIKRINVKGTDTLGKYSFKQDTLVLEYISDDFYSDEKTWFIRLKPKREILFDSIFLKTSICYGLCPSMELMIDCRGDFYFKGKAYTEKLGNYHGQLSRELIDLINEKFQQLDFTEYDSAYFARHTDGQTRYLVVYHENIRENIQIYGHESEPLEVNVFLHYLTELYKWIDLEKMDSEIQFEDIERLYQKPPKPPEGEKVLDILDYDSEKIEK